MFKVDIKDARTTPMAKKYIGELVTCQLDYIRWMFNVITDHGILLDKERTENFDIHLIRYKFLFMKKWWNEGEVFC